MTETLYWFWICGLQTVGRKTIQRLLEYFGDISEVFQASKQILEKLEFLNPKMLEELIESRDIDKIQSAYQMFIGRGYKFVFLDAPEYPECLKYIYEYPYGLYYYGRLPDEKRPSVAIVGARYCSARGRATAENFASKLAGAGVQVISGMALGIDGAAHRGALSAGADTYAVLGCGLDRCYPRENIDLYRKIPVCGGLISEYPVGRQPLAWQFPMRNRIISGLVDKVLVVEARRRSGSLITADMALEQGRDVLAVPGRPEDALSEGCNALIKAGARLVTDPSELLEEFDLVAENVKKNNICLAYSEDLVYSSLCLTPKYIEDISNELHMDIKEVISIAYKLEKKGLIRQIYKNQYVLTK